MTGPDEDSLAARVSRLGEHVQATASTVDAITRILGHHASVANALDGLDQQVAAIASQIAELAAKAAATDDTSYQPVPAPRWWRITDTERQAAVDRLRVWVEQVYKPGYGHLVAALPACWEQHVLCLHTLDWLSELWSAPYLSRERTASGALAGQAEWQTRLLPAAVAQMSAEAASCQHAASKLRRLPCRPTGPDVWSSIPLACQARVYGFDSGPLVACAIHGQDHPAIGVDGARHGAGDGLGDPPVDAFTNQLARHYGCGQLKRLDVHGQHPQMLADPGTLRLSGAQAQRWHRQHGPPRSGIHDEPRQRRIPLTERQHRTIVQQAGDHAAEPRREIISRNRADAASSASVTSTPKCSASTPRARRSRSASSAAVSVAAASSSTTSLSVVRRSAASRASRSLVCRDTLMLVSSSATNGTLPTVEQIARRRGEAKGDDWRPPQTWLVEAKTARRADKPHLAKSACQLSAPGLMNASHMRVLCGTN